MDRAAGTGWGRARGGRFGGLLLILWSAGCAGLAGCPALRVAPAEGPQGAEGLELELTGEYTHWVDGQTEVLFPDAPGIVVRTAEFPTATSGHVVVDIGPSVPVGPTRLLVRTGAEEVEATFTVGAGPEVQAEPGSVERAALGQRVRLLGTHTHFGAPGFAVVLALPDARVTGVSVLSDTEAVVTLDTGLGTLEGVYPGALVVHTDFQDVPVDLEVTPVQGRYVECVPDAVVQGEGQLLRLVGHKTAFDATSLAAHGVDVAPGAASGVTVHGTARVVGPEEVQAELWAHTGAELGPRTVTVWDPWGPLRCEVTVEADATPPGLTLQPGRAPLRWTGRVVAAGQDTHFTAGQTWVEVVPPGQGLDVALEQVVSGQEVWLGVRVDIDTPPGDYDLWLHTGPEDVVAAFTVDPLPPPSVAVSPSTGMQGETVAVLFAGTDTHFEPGETAVTVSGPGASGVLVQGVHVQSATELAATLVVAEDAPVGPVQLSVQTPSWRETVSADFEVLAGTPSLHIAPEEVAQGAVGVEIVGTGRFTHFGQGRTTVTVVDGGGVAGCGMTVRAVAVSGPTQLSFWVDVDEFAPVASCQVVMETDTGAGVERVSAPLAVVAGYVEAPSIPWTFDGELTGQPERTLIFLEAGQVLRVRVRRKVWESLDPEIALYALGSSGTGGGGSGGASLVAWNDDERVGGTEARLVYQVAESGQYVLEVFDHWGLHDGQYQVDLGWYAPCGEEDGSGGGAPGSAPGDGLEAWPLAGPGAGDVSGPGGAVALGRSAAEVLAGACVRGRFQTAIELGSAEPDRTDWYVVPAPPAGVDLAVRVLAQRVSPFPTSGAEVVLRVWLDPFAEAPLGSASGSLDSDDPVIVVRASDLDRPSAGGGPRPFWIEVSRAEGSASGTGYWVAVSPWLRLGEVRLWPRPGAPDFDASAAGAFVEIQGAAEAWLQPGDPLVPSAPLAGCWLELGDGGQEVASIDLAGSVLTATGRLVLAHDASVPGVAAGDAVPQLGFGPEAMGPYGVSLWCNGQQLDVVQVGGSGPVGPLWCEGAPALLPPDPDVSLGRGFGLDSGDGARDWHWQEEPSPWEANVTEVR